MESTTIEDVVIVGAGVAGLATALGLHRLGIRSLVLESSDCLRVTGFAFGMWTNAWRALDALGIAQILRDKHIKLTGLSTTSVISGLTTSDISFSALASRDDVDVFRCVIRKVLLETLENELPTNTVRYSSKVLHIETQGYIKSVHLSDGTILKTKVLIGCDGVNSIVSKYLGFNNPSVVGRSAVRGFIHYENSHGLGTKMLQFFGNGVRYGVIPCDDHGIYWFFTFSPSPQEKGMEEEEDPMKLKQFILSKLGNVPDRIREVFEGTKVTNMVCAPLRFRHPWELVWANISKDNVCVAGDAFHAMTPDIGQGACSALEDSVVLARVLGEALKEKGGSDVERIKKGLEKYARMRRWRGIDLITTSYMVGYMQQSNGVVMNFVRDKILAKVLSGVALSKTAFDCGNLITS